MRKLHIVMPMGGLGSRFSDAGFTLPKPLIPVCGIPMFMKAITSVDEINAEKRITAIIRQEHQQSFHLADHLRAYLPSCSIIIIPELTRGALETAAAAEPEIENEAGILLLDCDLWFRSNQYNHLVESSLDGAPESYDGVLTYFHSKNPRYSYAKLSDNQVVETAEKRQISTNALVGAYFFRNKKMFFDTARRELQKTLPEGSDEYYSAPLYNRLIKQGFRIGAASIDEYYSFGTPQELRMFETR